MRLFRTAVWEFNHSDLLAVDEALDIAEDATVNYFRFSSEQWKRHQYDVKTLSCLNENEKISDVFALLSKGFGSTDDRNLKTRRRDYYFICLQDDQILQALKKDMKLSLLPLLVYILTHELIHIVRFCNFFQRFEVSEKARDREETIVHAMTFEILKKFSLKRMDYVLDSYQGHRICDMAW